MILKMVTKSREENQSFINESNQDNGIENDDSYIIHTGFYHMVCR